ncbi:polyphosphate polymerase domain-containing protein [uncultured Tateyamaria sp.]|uniref:polyphosphate polymerase domain-containing protein n=1 Tax=uncultured Tateyamaria sp. TaxID=455651 RepID=UPI00261EE54F|nr:polyphosphate polymerase domain-containing protein [uncultured Tateyamaria sp.]
MNLNMARALTSFDAISLEALNEKAAMLERLDNKYIVPIDQLLPALVRFKDLFDVLEISGKRSFLYATEYHDDKNARSYFDHHQGRRKRCKIRVRTYVDAGFSYLEVKLKDRRNVTVKKRLKLAGCEMGLSNDALTFIDRCHFDIYGAPLNRRLMPVIKMRYARITLVAKEGGERMTIDTNLSFHNHVVERHVAPDHFILETKSARGNGMADRILRGEHLHPTKQCSKYCMGMAALGAVERHNRFLPALRRLRVFDQPLMYREAVLEAA